MLWYPGSGKWLVGWWHQAISPAYSIILTNIQLRVRFSCMVNTIVANDLAPQEAKASIGIHATDLYGYLPILKFQHPEV